MYDRKETLKREYEQKLAEIEREQRCCCHEWEEPVYNPETKQVPYGFKITGRGADIWSEPEGYRDEKVPRWSRRCKKCGKVEYTYKQKTKTEVTTYGPDFSSETGDAPHSPTGGVNHQKQTGRQWETRIPY